MAGCTRFFAAFASTAGCRRTCSFWRRSWPPLSRRSPLHLTPPGWLRNLRDAGRSLEAGNAASFLFYFDHERFADYSALESDVDALTRHSEIASSTEVTNVEAEGEAYLVEVDWILRLRPISALGGIDTRRKLLKLRFERIKDRWKIVKLQPIEFFRAR